MKLANDCDLNYKQSQNKRLLVELTLIEMAQLSSDEGETSGLCPTKILKPIFDKLRATQATPSPKGEALQNAQQPEKPAAPEMSGHAATTGRPAVPASPQAVSPTSTQRTPHPTPSLPLHGLGSFSLRRAAETAAAPAQAQQTATAQTTETVMENKPVTEVDLTVAWREFAQQLPREDTAMSHQMNNMEPVLQEDGTTFLVIVDNPSVQGNLTKMQPRIETYLHQRLQNGALRMTTRLREVTDKRRAYSRVEVLNMMLEQSEPLRKLKEEFQLELN